ncbi:MAG: hypothetical protein HY315_02525 [Acidobacteria bacterium]|nr:hypothetical protein [Acidobacteriota bacterium]
MKAESVSIRREDLYNQVWSEPLLRPAKQYALSDVGLAKICRKMQIPLPGVGYWQKKQYGQAVRQAPLPALKDNVPAEVELKKRSQAAETESEISGPEAFERRPENKITVDQVLNSPHPYVARSEAILKKSRPDRIGLVSPRKRRCLAIRVSPENIDRALRIIDALVKAMESRGLRVSLDTQDEKATAVQVGEEILEFSLEEFVNKTERELTPAQKKANERDPWLYRTPEFDYHSTGKLFLRIKGTDRTAIRKTWKDGNGRIEECLNKFIIGLLRVAEARKAERLEQERWQREWKEQERKRIELERRRYEEEQRLQQLDREIAAWQKSQQIRAYVEAVRQRAIQKHGQIAPASKVDQWINWATRWADEFDPLIGDQPELPKGSE